MVKKTRIIILALLVVVVSSFTIITSSATHITGNSSNNYYNYLDYSFTPYFSGMNNTQMVSTGTSYLGYSLKRLPINAPVTTNHPNGITSQVTSVGYSDGRIVNDYTIIDNEENNSYPHARFDVRPFVFYRTQDIEQSFGDVLPSVYFTGIEHASLDSISYLTLNISYRYYDRANELHSINETVEYAMVRDSSYDQFTDIKARYVRMFEEIEQYSQDTPCEVTRLRVDFTIPTSFYDSTGRQAVSRVSVVDHYFNENSRNFPRMGINSEGVIVKVETIDTDFTSWIGQAVQGFWSFQLFPSITIGTIVLSLIGMALLIMFLKHFAGG